ncbi:MAG TPA: ADP/ATP-dependent (S)-NAD(P)H-hydrate dehydratase, partial [Acidimicrobiales bacterium]|nr:ADP/ATP-dependent (S)-NAD(P)H-hydrate dehydratase [Acidimicrobiales bacterium]
PGAEPAALPPGSEAVAVALPGQGWARPAMEEAGRARAMVVGPGVGRDDATLAEVRHLVSEAEVPMVVDADGLLALGPDQWTPPERLPAPRVLTPHDGEFERLTGARPEADRIGAARRLAERTRAVVLLKGPTTVVSGPGGDVLLSATGDPRLATAGTGDVLSGVVAAFMAQGMDPFWAAGIGAHVHGTAARSGHARGLVAGDLPDLLAAWLSDHA